MTQNSETGRLSWRVLTGLYALALVPRALHLLAIRDAPLFRYLFLDPLYYDEWGRSIAAGQWLGERIFFQDPAYPYFLGVAYSLFGHSYLAVVTVQILLGSLAAPLLFLAARRWFGDAAAIVAGVLAALYAPSIYYDGLVLKTWMGTVLLVAAFALLSRALVQPRPGLWFGTGLCFGVAALARGNVLLFLPVLVLWLLLDRLGIPPRAPQDADHRPGLRVRLADRRVQASVLMLAAGIALPLAASALRNRVVGGEWVLTTANAGQNFYIGNNPANTEGDYAPLPFVDANPKYEERDFRREAERRTGRELGTSEVSHFWFREGLGWIREHPGDWLRLMRRKLANFLDAYEIPDNLDYYLYRESSWVLRLPLPGFGLIAPLGLLGIGMAWARPGWPRALLLFLVVYTASVVLFFVFSRFRMAILPVLFVFGGYAAVKLFATVLIARRNKAAWAVLALYLVVLLGLMALVNLPVRAPSSHWTVRLASAVGLPVRVETTAMGHYNLALSFAIQAEGAANSTELLELAEAELRESLRQDDGQAAPHAELGKLLARSDRTPEAIAAYERAVSLDPNEWTLARNLAVLYRRSGDRAAAERWFRASAELAPQSAYLQVQLGELALESGRAEQAIARFRRALALEPESGQARRGLTRALRQHGASPAPGE